MKRRRRVVIVVSFTNLGGAQLAALRIARGLSDLGHHVRLVFLYQQATALPPDYPFDVLVPKGRLGALDYTRILSRLMGIFRHEKPDCVFSFLPLASVFGQATALFCCVDKRIVCHRFPINTAKPIMRWLDLAWAWLGFYTAVVAVSESVRQTCTLYPRWLRARIRVVYNGLKEWHPSILSRAEARARFGVADGEFALVAVGRLSPEKNYPFMLRIIGALENATLLIAGEGNMRPELERLVQQIETAKVRLLGAIARDEIPDLLTAADVFIQTSIFEGHSNSTLEALQSGLPALVPDIPAQRETLVDSDGQIPGALLPLEEISPWISALEHFRNDPAAAETTRRASLRRAQFFGYDRMIAGFESAVLED